jgi:hypothetical protein
MRSTRQVPERPNGVLERDRPGRNRSRGLPERSHTPRRLVRGRLSRGQQTGQEPAVRGPAATGKALVFPFRHRYCQCR